MRPLANIIRANSFAVVIVLQTVKANEADALRKQTHVMMQSLHKNRNALKDVLQENKTLVSMCASYRVTAACTAESANMADVVTEV